MGIYTLMGNKEHKLHVELAHLKRKGKARVCLRFLRETRGITSEPTTLLSRNRILVLNTFILNTLNASAYEYADG